MGSELRPADLPHKATLRAVGAVDAYGKQTVQAAIEIDSRWELGVKTSSDALNAKEQIVGTIYVDRPIGVGSILWKGEKDSEPADPTGLVRVIEYREVPDIKGLDVVMSVLVASQSGIPGG